MVGIWPVLGSSGIAQSTPITVNDLTTLDGGYIEVNWDDSTLLPAATAWRVYVRQAGTDGWHLAYETLDMTQASYTYDLYNFPTCSAVEIAVSQVSPNLSNGLPVLGPLDIIETVNPTYDHHYWLIDPYDATKNVRLEHCRADRFSEDRSDTVYALAERGRVVDRGDRLGFTGSLSGQFWDTSQQPLSAYEQVMDFLVHRASAFHTYLRTPFCWVFPISIDGFSAQRVEGMGTDYAYLNYDFNYVELEGNNPEYNAAAAGIVATVVGLTTTSTVSGYQLSRSIPVFDLTDIQLVPEVVNRSGTAVSVAVAAQTPPVGGSEVWGISVDGSEFATVELAAGQQASPVQTLTTVINAGQVVDIYPKSTTATTPSRGSTVTLRIEDL